MIEWNAEKEKKFYEKKVWLKTKIHSDDVMKTTAQRERKKKWRRTNKRERKKRILRLANDMHDYHVLATKQQRTKKIDGNFAVKYKNKWDLMSIWLEVPQTTPRKAIRFIQWEKKAGREERKKESLVWGCLLLERAPIFLFSIPFLLLIKLNPFLMGFWVIRVVCAAPSIYIAFYFRRCRCFLLHIFQNSSPFFASI